MSTNVLTGQAHAVTDDIQAAADAIAATWPPLTAPQLAMLARAFADVLRAGAA